MGRAASWYPAGRDPADGNPVVLDDGSPGPMFVRPGATGLEAPTWTVTLVSTPGVTGARFQQAVAGTREITIPIHLCAKTRTEMRAVKNSLIRAINPEGGPGILELSDAVTTESATQRCISAVYAGGLEGDESVMRVGDRDVWWEFEVKFTGLDHWYSADLLHATWRGKASTPFFHSGPFLPFTLAPQGVDVDVELEVQGDAGSWPTYELTGPFTRIRVTNPRSQRLEPENVRPDSWWEIGRVTSSTEMLRLVTKPNEESLRLYQIAGDGSWVDAGNVWSARNPDSSFEALISMDELEVDADGTGSGTLIELWAQETWLTHG